MKNDLEQFKALMGDPIKQLEDIVAGLKLERDKLETKPQPKPQVPTTIEQVYNDVKPKSGILTRVVSNANANQVEAFAQLINLVACLDSHFGDVDEKFVWYINRDFEVEECRVNWYSKPLITFKTEQAAEHAIEHFKPLFERYYGVSE